MGVDTTDTGVELMCFGVKCASEKDESDCAIGVVKVPTVYGVAALTDIICLVAV